ncbi:MAG: PAS-domain containing protein, partial [Roseateles sp.]
REQSLLAVAYAGFIMQELMAHLEQVADGHLDVELFDGAEPREEALLYVYAHAGGVRDSAFAGLELQRQLGYGGRGFSLRLRSNAAFVQASARGRGPGWVLAFGLLASAALGLAVAALLASRARAAADARRLSGDVDRLSHVAQATADAVLFLGRRGQIQWANEGFSRMTGLSEAAVLGRPSAALLESADTPAERQLAQALARGAPCSVEQQIQRQDGSHVWAQRELLPLHDAQGRLQGFVEILHDVSRLKQAQASAAAALAESQALWRAVEALAIVSVGDLQGNILEANEAFARISGYSREELIGRNHSLVSSGQMPADFWARMWELIASGQPWRGQICNRAKNGSLYWVDSMIAPVLGPDGMPQRYVSIRVDITQSRLAAEEIQRQRQRLQNIIEGTGAGTWELDLQSGEAVFSARWKQMLGLEGGGEMRGDLQTWRSRVHPADLGRAEDMMSRHLAGELPIYDVEVRMRHSAGHWVWIHARGQVRSRDAQGRPLSMAGTHVEISERKRAQQHLDKSRQLLARAERLADVGSWELDLRSREFSASAGLLALLERGDEPLHKIADLMAHFPGPERERLQEAMALAERSGGGWDLELEFESARGRKGWLRSVGSVELEDERPRRLLGVLMDVSARRLLEARTRRSLDLLRSVLDNLPCGLSVFDADLIMVADNRQFRELLGFPDQLFEGEHTRFEDIIRFNGARGEYGDGPDVPAVVEQIIERARHPVAHAFERSRPNGTTLEVRGAPMPGGGFVTTYVDISERKRLEAAREEAMSLLRTVIESLPCGLAYIDPQANIVLSNARFWSQLSIDRAQVGEGAVPLRRQVELSWAQGDYGDITLEQALAGAEQRVATALREPFVWERNTPGGGIMEVRSNPAPLGLVATYTDVTELRRAVQQRLQAEALLRGAIDTVNEAFVLYDPEDKLLLCNEKYRQLYAASADLIVPGASFEQIIRRGAERGQYQEAIGRVEEWVQERLEAHRRADTQTIQHLRDDRWVRVVERRMPDGHIVGFRIDITDLMRATQAAEEASQAKSRFLANMSHELRTPMNAILGMLQLLQRSALDARQRDYAVRIDGAARSLLALLNDILDFSKVEAGKMTLDPQPFMLDQLLSEVEVILQATRGEKPLWLALERDPLLPSCLLGDALRLKQVLINLGGNAIKFTAEGEVSLRLAQVWRRADRVCLSVEVRDTGIGIAPEHQQQIFAGFSQAEASTTRRYGGTGLGLAISQRLVQLMGAELKLQSELGKGSCFSFTLELPVLEASALPTAAPGIPQPGATRRLAGLRLLLVEDNPNNQLVARELLQDEGALVELAENGLQALQRLDQMLAQGEPRFDVVLMDVQMPVMDGFTATRRLRERPELATLPVVAMTANVMASDRAECLAAGMNEHVGKPFDLELLVALLQRLCGRTSSGASALTEAAELGLPAALLQEAEQAGLDLPGALKRLGGRRDLLARMARGFASSTEAL